jgi:hypothetical protein
MTSAMREGDRANAGARSVGLLHGIPRQLAIAVAVVLMVGANMFGGGGGGFNGSGSNDVYSADPTAFTPAVYTFLVWAPIFIGALAFAVYQALPSRRVDRRIDAAAVPLVIAYLLTASTAYTPLGLSNVVMVLLLASLAWAFVSVARLDPQAGAFFWYVHAPLAVFFGWITAATILNAFQWLSSKGVEAFGPNGSWAAALLILIAAAVGVAVTVRYRDAVYALTLVWASWGIVAAHTHAAVTIVAAAVATAVLLAVVVWRFRGGGPRAARTPPNDRVGRIRPVAHQPEGGTS